ncbi:hypothetical protein POPTR_019G042001v4 [Populus trichocarpa]|uniref:Uncharacterized protein n=1 Tax=Populus trichocarpa TaxID=3694 RepID=A0ACC0RL36_POPTR|nr:hypothetical protein POPTR_019G042001v4 [Populus trichocarpa]
MYYFIHKKKKNPKTTAHSSFPTRANPNKRPVSHYRLLHRLKPTCSLTTKFPERPTIFFLEDLTGKPTPINLTTSMDHQSTPLIKSSQIPRDHHS